ncbi:MAG TPA: hypothetical protein PK280_11945 [Planctomycetota bacterium]|nr:hypothetical protein [Planctomycetota bacterium]
MVTLPRITFGIIVLNGEPFTRYNLRSIYPFAHQIVVVEGASPHAACIAGPDGHSTDGTLEVLRRFKAEEDPKGKLQIVTAEDCGHPNGFWPGEKDEQSQAYATRATGDWLWQVDIDEFYRPEDVRKVMEVLGGDPSITGVSFPTLTVWGAPEYQVCGPHFRGEGGVFHRLFRFGPGYKYVAHRPPTVLDAHGRNLRAGHWIDVGDPAIKGVLLFHYALLFPKQVLEKCTYYSVVMRSMYPEMKRWAEEDYLLLKDPYRVHTVYTQPSWLKRVRQEHPNEVMRMMTDIRAGKVRVELRQTKDIEQLLRSFTYRIGCMLFQWLELLSPGKLKPLQHSVGYRALPVLATRVLKVSLRKLVPDSWWVALSRAVRGKERIRWGNLRRLQPISSKFGFDRGKPIDRYYIERFLAAKKGYIRGRVLEVGDPCYTRQFGGDKVSCSDVLHRTPGNPNATIVGDLATGAGIPTGAFDCIILTQTLPCIYDLRGAISTLYRSLAPAGVLLVTVPGLAQISRVDMDQWGEYWRFTDLSLQYLLAEAFGNENVTVEAHGNVLAACALLQGIAAQELKQSELDFTHPDYPVNVTAIAIKAKG